MKSKKFACGERLQRFLIAFIMLLILGLLAKGYNLAALILLAFISIMFVIYGVFDFCPSIWLLNKIFGSCYSECNEKKEEKNENQL